MGSLERWDSQEWPVATCSSQSESQLGSVWTTGLRADHPVCLCLVLIFLFIFQARGLRVGWGLIFVTFIAAWWVASAQGPKTLLQLSPDKQGLFFTRGDTEQGVMCTVTSTKVVSQ